MKTYLLILITFQTSFLVHAKYKRGSQCFSLYTPEKSMRLSTPIISSSGINSIDGTNTLYKNAWLKTQSADVSAITLLKPFAKKHHMKFAGKNSDANCFNAVIGWFKGRIALRESFNTELLEFLDKNSSKIYHQAQPPKNKFLHYEDIILIWGHSPNKSKEPVLVHAMISIEQNLVWHKPSSRGDDLHSFSTLNEVQQKYQTYLSTIGLTPEYEVRRHNRNFN